MPEIGGIKHGRDIGLKSPNDKYIGTACVVCGVVNWIPYKRRGLKPYKCTRCCRLGGKLSHATRPPTLAEIGKIKTGEELGFKYTKQSYIGEACPNCGNLRWVQVGDAGKRQKCVKCKLVGRYGEQSHSWKGGKRISKSGYVEVKLTPDSPYWGMAKKSGYVLEHRLVMAQQLGRCLDRSEEVHHRGVNYPLCTKENKSDKSPENLLLVTIEHNTMGEKQLINLTKQVKRQQATIIAILARLTILEAENTALKYSQEIGSIQSWDNGGIDKLKKVW